MKNKSLLILVISLFFLVLPKLNFGQVLNLGTLVNFVAVTGAGAVTNAGTSTYTGNIGTNVGVISGFDAPTVVNGTIYNATSQTAQAKIDMLNVYIYLSDIPVTNTGHSAVFGGETITPGVYSIAGAGSLAGAITLDGGGNTDAVFIIKFGGAFTVGVSSSVVLTNGTRSANVFWIAEGAISIGTSCIMKGTLFSAPGAISFAADGSLDGRMLATEGAITFGPGTAAVPTSTCTIPIICNTTCSNSILGTAVNYALFSSAGTVSNTSSSSSFIGDIGSNEGAVTGFATSVVVGNLYTTPNSATAQAKIDLLAGYNTLIALPVTNSTHTAAFGSGETLTPGVYSIAAAGSLAGNLTLNGQGDPAATFVFKFGGAFTTAAQSKVILTNGARRCNIFWIAEGAIDMGAFTVMKGNMIAHGGANNMGANGSLEGSMFSTLGAVSFSTGVVYINQPASITTQPSDASFCSSSSGSASFTVAAAGTSVTYQWQVSVNEGAFTNISNTGVYTNATTATLNISVITGLNNNRYQVVITSPAPCSTSVTSTPKKINISNTWITTNDNVWNTGANWTCGAPPSAGDNIIIPAGTHQPALPGDITVNDVSLNGTFTIGSNTLTVNGAVTGTGTLTGSATSNLVINGAAGTLNFTSGTSLNNLTLASTASATLGTALSVYGNINTNINGALNLAAFHLTLKSNSTNTASIDQLAADGSNLTGATNVTVERWIPLRQNIPLGGRAYRVLGSTVTTTTTIAANWMEGGMNTVVGTNTNPVPLYGVQITGAGGNAGGFDVTQTNASSLYTFTPGNNIVGNTGYPAVTNVTTGSTLNALTGYFLYTRGDRTTSNASRLQFSRWYAYQRYYFKSQWYGAKGFNCLSHF